jgi:hypothetical protein
MRIRDDSLFAPPANRMTHRNDALFPQQAKNQDRTLIETVHQTAVLTTLTAILEMAGLESELSSNSGAGPYTVIMRKLLPVVMLHCYSAAKAHKLMGRRSLFTHLAKEKSIYSLFFPFLLLLSAWNLAFEALPLELMDKLLQPEW